MKRPNRRQRRLPRFFPERGRDPRGSRCAGGYGEVEVGGVLLRHFPVVDEFLGVAVGGEKRPVGRPVRAVVVVVVVIIIIAVVVVIIVIVVVVIIVIMIAITTIAVERSVERFAEWFAVGFIREFAVGLELVGRVDVPGEGRIARIGGIRCGGFHGFDQENEGMDLDVRTRVVRGRQDDIANRIELFERLERY